MLNKIFSNVFFSALFLILGITFLSLFIKNTIIFCAFSIIFIYFFVKKIRLKNFKWFLFIYSLIIRVVAVFLLKTPIESDFKVLYDASTNLLNGDLSFNQIPYFKLWGYQIGQVVYQTLLLKICNSVIFLKIINSIISSGIVVLVYLISKELFKEKTARFISLLYSIFLFPILFNAVLSNQILSTFLTYLAIYILFAKRFNKWSLLIRYPLVGILLGGANIIRPEGIVVLTTIIVFYLFLLCKDNIKKTIQKAICILFSYYALVTISSLILILTNISPIGLKNNDPLWKFVLGFNHESVGLYSTKDEYVLGNKELELKLIKERTIGSIEKVPILFIKKTRNFWFASDIYWSNNYLENQNINILGTNISGSNINEILTNYNKYIYYFMYGCLFIGLYKTRKEKKNELSTFLTIFVCVYIGVYLLIEIMPRYAYLPQVALFILSGFGIEYLLNLLEVKRK